MVRMACKSKESQRGMALVLVLILVFILSALAAAMMFSNGTDISTAGNYRFVTQSRFTAEAGAQAAANWVMFSLAMPTSTVGIVDLTKYPVQDTSGKPVVLNSDGSGNYPWDSNQLAVFQKMISDLNAGNTIGVSLLPQAKVAVTATLLSMQLLPGSMFGNIYVQSWEIKSTGTASALKPVQVQVVERIGEQSVPAIGNAVFAAGNACPDLALSGSISTDSYNSALGPQSSTNTGLNGNIGANGTVSFGGSASVGGSLYSPLTGADQSCGGAFEGSFLVSKVVKLSAPVVYPSPVLPNPLPPTTSQSVSTSCPSGMTGCSVVAGKVSLAPSPGTNYGDVSITGTVHLAAGTYNMDRLLSNSGTIVLDGPVTIVVTCPAARCSELPFDFTGHIFGSDGNSNIVAGNLTVVYAGTAPMTKLNGNGSFCGVLYAPNADMINQFNGGFDWYGAIVAKSMKFANGNAAIHFDDALLKGVQMAGGWHVTSFTWSKY